MIILLTIAAVIALSVLAGVYAYRNGIKHKAYEPTFDAVAVGVVTAFIAGFVLSFVNVAYESSTDKVEHYRVPLTAIGAGSATEGRIGFLGGGQIDTRGVFWYYRTDNGATTLHYRYASNTLIYQDETGQPYMDCYEPESAGPYAFLNEHTFTIEAKCDFHIPPDSVIQNYKLETP